MIVQSVGPGVVVVHLPLLQQRQLPPLLLQFPFPLLPLPLLLLVGRVEVELVVRPLHLVQSLVFIHLQLSPVLRGLQQLLVPLVLSVLLGLSVHVFLLDLLVEVFFLQPLVLPGALMVAQVFPNHKGDPRAVLSLPVGGVFPVVCLLGALHLQFQ